MRFINSFVINWKNIDTFIKDTSLDSVTPNPLDMLPKQSWDGILTFWLSALNFNI